MICEAKHVPTPLKWRAKGASFNERRSNRTGLATRRLDRARWILSRRNNYLVFWGPLGLPPLAIHHGGDRRLSHLVLSHPRELLRNRNGRTGFDHLAYFGSGSRCRNALGLLVSPSHQEMTA